MPSSIGLIVIFLEVRSLCHTVKRSFIDANYLRTSLHLNTIFIRFYPVPDKGHSYFIFYLVALGVEFSFNATMFPHHMIPRKIMF